MKNIKRILSLLLVVLFFVPFSSVEAKDSNNDKQADSKTISSFVDVYVGGGYSKFLNKIEGVTTPGGGTGMLGLGYFMKHKSAFNFRTGLEFMYFNSSMLLDPKPYEATYSYPGITSMSFYMDLANYKELQNRFLLNIPVMFGAEFNSIYFLVGAKVGVGLMGNYSMKSSLTSYIDDSEVDGKYENMSTHNLGTYSLSHKGSLKFGVDVAASIELGLCLDGWMPEKAKSLGAGSISYRLGLFADLGVLNVNANPTDEDLIVNRANTIDGDGKTMALSQVLNLKPYSVLGSNMAASKSLNSFVIGAKFTVLFGVDREPKVEKWEPRRRPIIRDISYVSLPTFLYMYIRDFDTDEPLDATIKVYTLGEKSDTLFAGVSDKETGFIEHQIDDGLYGITITRPGYIDYTDTLFSISNATLSTELHPIKKNTVIVLRNLLFDTNKTTIRNVSTSSLEELYQLLSANPSIRIRITGHTDNVGSERYNKKLSEGRAKAVYDEMVSRGIDPSRMEWEGRGSKEPIESNKTEEGRAENRRVEFKILSE